MRLRILLSLLCLAFCALPAGCGDDDEDTKSQTSQKPASAAGGKLASGDPRPNAPNVVGTGDMTTKELVERFAADASDYWAAAFEASSLPYARPKVRLVNEVTNPGGDDGCGGKIDLNRQAYSICAAQDGVLITYSEKILTKLVLVGAGDGSNLLVIGLAVASDANDQLHGQPLSHSDAPKSFAQESLCLTGAWINDLGRRKQLEEGDLAEVVAPTPLFVKYDDKQELPAALNVGSHEGAAACQQKYAEAA